MTDGRAGTRARLLAAVRARVDWFKEFRDAEAVLDPGALAEVAGLLEAVPDIDNDLEAATAAAQLHWCRFLVLDPGDDEQDLLAALRLFEPVYRMLPDEVPEQV